ncbi:MAG: ATP synthase F1 subunit delta [Clostridia bacterium]|nr:ATP synthase F1 subunit delta [Clostridia bacterium]
MSEVAKEYGAALFMVAAESEQTAAFAEDLTAIGKAFEDNPDYIPLLSSPNIPMDERLLQIEQAFGGAVQEPVLAFLQLLCQKGHIREWEAAAQEYQALWQAAAQVCDAVVTSAVPLSEPQQQKLLEKLEQTYGKTVRAVYRVDPAVMGGLIVEMDGKVLDGSLRERLRDIKDVMHR